MYLIILFISAVRTVSRGHQLVAEGWALFEKTCSEVGVGELPQLLRYAKQATTPTPTPTSTPTPTPIKEEQGEEAMDVKHEEKPTQIWEKPIHVTEGGENSLLQVPQL